MWKANANTFLPIGNSPNHNSEDPRDAVHLVTNVTRRPVEQFPESRIAEPEPQQKTSICRICAEKMPNDQCNAEMHRCDVCMQQFHTKTWPMHTVKNHTRCTKRKLVCTRCSENGYTTKDVNTYQCKDCGNCMGNKKFGKKDLKNLKARGNPALLSCSRCKALVKCVTCKNGYEKGYWSTTARKNAKHKGYALVCKECRKRGCTSRNPALYTCTTCSEMFGAAKLDAISFTNFKQHGRTTLTCSNCMNSRKPREGSIQTILSKHKRKCIALLWYARNVGSAAARRKTQSCTPARHIAKNRPKKIPRCLVPLFANGSPNKDMTLEQIKTALGKTGWQKARNLFRTGMATKDKTNWSPLSPDQKLERIRQWILNPTMPRLSGFNEQNFFTLEQAAN